METDTLTNISPLDGRYAEKVDEFRPIFSEFGLIYYRLTIEIRWLQTLSKERKIKQLQKFTRVENQFLEALIDEFDTDEAEKVKAFEAKTNHDVKAVEYYLKEKFREHPTLSDVSEMIHFACTSEDINNIAHGIMLNHAKHTVMLPMIESLYQTLVKFAEEYADIPMLSRTHGQPASPTTVGKEFANFAARLDTQARTFAQTPITGKINGAVGNYNAHVLAYPDVGWRKLSKHFVESLGLDWNEYTTQIEPHDQIAALLHSMARVNTILIDLARDFWGYISLGYFNQKIKEDEVGSSTMPNKVNPIDFENAEGNLGIANCLIHHFAEKLPCSRWQRDLTDSTVLRNLGTIFSHSLLAYKSLMKGFDKLVINIDALNQDLYNNWEVLAEAIQTMMRKHGIEAPYEQLKALTRGKEIDQQTLRIFIDNLHLPEDVKTQLKALTPQTYIGLAKELAKDI